MAITRNILVGPQSPWLRFRRRSGVRALAGPPIGVRINASYISPTMPRAGTRLAGQPKPAGPRAPSGVCCLRLQSAYCFSGGSNDNPSFPRRRLVRGVVAVSGLSLTAHVFSRIPRIGALDE